MVEKTRVLNKYVGKLARSSALCVDGENSYSCDDDYDSATSNSFDFSPYTDATSEISPARAEKSFSTDQNKNECGKHDEKLFFIIKRVSELF